DDVDLGVVLDRVVALVVVDALLRDAVAQCELARLVGVPAHERDHPRLLALREGGQDLIDREAAEPDDRPAELLPRRLRHLLRPRPGGEPAERLRGGEGASGLAKKGPPGEIVLWTRHALLLFRSVDAGSIALGPVRGGPAPAVPVG